MENCDTYKTEKEARLLGLLRGYGRAAVAYSGGIDSHFLLTAAVRALGRENVLAVFCRGVMMPEEEAKEAVRLLEGMGANYEILDADVLAIPEFAANDKRRCYFCKKHLMGQIWACAKKNGFAAVLDGKNADDAHVYRPGAQAAQELSVCSPLFESGFTKRDIRESARKWGIPIWNKPSQACLASRFPYDTQLTAEKLQKVGRAEQILHGAGFANCRVRVHGDIARIELPTDQMEALTRMPEETKAIKLLGFSFVTLDLEGIRSGVFD